MEKWLLKGFYTENCFADHVTEMLCDCLCNTLCIVSLSPVLLQQ